MMHLSIWIVKLDKQCGGRHKKKRENICFLEM